MRYAEDRDSSAALLRLAVAQLGQHDAPMHPISYAVWYEHVAGINPRLSAAIAEAQANEPRLSDETVRRLHTQHVADVDEATAQRISAQLQQLMQAMSDSAASTDRAAGTFGHRLDHLARALRERDAGKPLLATLEQALSHTSEMRSSVEQLQGQLDGSRQEMAQLRAALERSREDALVDPLTQVANRRAFDQGIHSLAAQAPAPGSTHVLALVDIDHFKRINDNHGHLVGDAVLQALGGLLQRLAAGVPGLQCSRYGGEEFALLMTNTTVADAQRSLERLRESVRLMKVRQRNVGELRLHVTVSAGLAVWRPGVSAADLIGEADEALYRAKAAGRDRVMLAEAPAASPAPMVARRA